MKSNSVARRLMGMNHWASRSIQVTHLKDFYSTKRGVLVSGWVAVRTRSNDFRKYQTYS